MPAAPPPVTRRRAPRPPGSRPSRPPPPPRPHPPPRGRGGERLAGREARHEGAPGRLSATHLRLLQDHLRDEDGVRVARAAEGEAAAVAVEPAEEGLVQSADLLLIGHELAVCSSQREATPEAFIGRLAVCPWRPRRPSRLHLWSRDDPSRSRAPACRSLGTCLTFDGTMDRGPGIP